MAGVIRSCLESKGSHPEPTFLSELLSTLVLYITPPSQPVSVFPDAPKGREEIVHSELRCWAQSRRQNSVHTRGDAGQEDEQV